MEIKPSSTGRFGLRQKAIGTMAAALAVIMVAVGITVYFQVLGQLKSSLEALGKELIKNVTSESMFDLVYEQKDNELKRLRKIILESEEVQYIIVLRHTKKGEAGIAGRPFAVFASEFREAGKPMDIDGLVDVHMSDLDYVAERTEFIGFTEEVKTGTEIGEGAGEEAAPGSGPDKAKDDSAETEALMFGELGGEEEGDATVKGGSKDTPKTEPAPEKKLKQEQAGSWGYVLLGLSTQKIQAQKSRLVFTLFIALLIALVAFTFFIYWASTKIYSRLIKMMEMARKISEGDLTESIPDVSPDEIGMLAEALNRITGNLNDMIRKIALVTSGLGEAMERITASTEEVVQGAEYQVAAVDETSSSISEMVISLKGVAENVEILASSAEESSSSIMEMAATNDEVADNINLLASSVEQTTTSIEQMTQAIKEVAKSVEDLSTTSEQTSTSMREMDVSIGQVETNANETADLSEEVRRDAERGSEAVKKTIQGISRISESTHEAFGAMEALGKKVQAIGQVLTVIDDVAEQTNLLALNAAIIAAQAGEHGKGFAVVADEIKDLAERTATSTNEISELVSAVQSETKSVINSMELGRQSVDQGVALSGEAEKALMKILESVTKSTQMVREIARATVEQARGSKVVTDAIGRIAETVGQIAAATGQQAKGSEQIMNSSERMKVTTQHVHSSSQEQARGSKQITGAIENISEMVHHLNRAQKEQTQGAEQVMQAVERIKEVAEHHSDSMSNMKKIVDLVAEQAETLRSEMSRFKL
ncbi:MAG TPA: methyl-accepting chemotaxis protein [Myxococcota bacterium]|nr:methyl-accepting chemotaxis protein [Myxococcota bacterium]